MIFNCEKPYICNMYVLCTELFGKNSSIWLLFFPGSQTMDWDLRLEKSPGVVVLSYNLRDSSPLFHVKMLNLSAGLAGVIFQVVVVCNQIQYFLSRPTPGRYSHSFLVTQRKTERKREEREINHEVQLELSGCNW